LTSDTDGDGIVDGYEVAHGLDPLVDDAALDLDGDTFDNVTEFYAGRSASDADDFPGHGTVLLNVADAHANIVLQPDALSFSVTEASGLGAIRSDISITQGSGWHYYEGYRLTDVGNFGFGVATAAASLTAVAGSDGQSVGVGADGNIMFNGTVVATLAAPGDTTSYGIAVDYTGINPVVFVIARPAGGDYEISPPISMPGVAADLYIFAYGESQSGVVQQSINAGQNKAERPFIYSARYLLYRVGHASAEFMREGWGSAFVYQPQTSIALESEVRFVRESMTSPLIAISRDGTEFGLINSGDRIAVRANQAMIGEFRYWEAELRAPPASAVGYGLLNPYALIDAFCCISTDLSAGAPSLILNDTGGIWRNLVWQGRFTSSDNYFGFAVDYTGSRPIVYVVHAGSVIYSRQLDDFIAPIVPMMHGGTGAVDVGPISVAKANFGQEPFRNDARQALIDAGVNVTQFVPGWGVYEQARNLADGPLTEPVISWTGATAGVMGQPLNITAVATDAEDGDLTPLVLWSNDQTADLATGGAYDFTPPNTGIYRVTARVTDSSGLEYRHSVDVSVTDTDTTSPVISVPPPLVAGLTSGASLSSSDAQIAGFLAEAAGRDDVDGTVTVSNDAPPTLSVGTTIINFTAADSAGNIGSAVSSITLYDAGAPVVTPPADLLIALDSGTYISANDPAIAAFLAGASATDDVDGGLTVTHDAPASLSTGVTVVTFSATDAAGNMGTATAAVTIHDAGLPVVTPPADINLALTSGTSVPASNAAVAAFLVGATATDDVDGALSVSNDAPTDFDLGVTTVIFSATDAAGNTGTAAATVTVADAGIPAVTAPADLALSVPLGSSLPSSDPSIVAFLAGASATDEADGALSVTHDAPANFPVGSTTVTFSATDAAGNTGTATATVTVNDGGAPTITAPDSITVSIAAGSSASISGPEISAFLNGATAVDAVDGAIAVTHNAPAAFPIGVTAVTFSATDTFGNTSTVSSNVTIVDGGVPHISAPADIAIDIIDGNAVPASEPTIAAFLDAATASDDVDGALPVTNDAPSAFAPGVTIVTFAASDAAGNSGAATASVSINMTNVAPSVTLLIEQGGTPSTTVTRDGGLVTLSAVVTDENVLDSHTYDWSGTNAVLLPPGGSTSSTLVFDPATLSKGVYALNIVVTDDGNVPLAGLAADLVRVIDTLPVLSSTDDTDRDGIADAADGAGDSDGDRIPDYLDPDSHAPEQLSAGGNGALIEASTGLVLRLGEAAFTIDATDGLLTIGDVEAWATALAGGAAAGMDSDYFYPAGIFNIEITNVPVGGNALVTIALADAIPANATLRGLTRANGWSRFLTDASNLVQSAPGGLGNCPPPGSSQYADGLTEGDFCLQILISDGGANDEDGTSDGTVRLLAGPAAYIGPDPNIQVQNRALSTSVFHANDGEQVVLDFVVTSDSDDAEINDLTIAASGDVNEATSIGNVSLYFDANDDGVAESSERLATGNYTTNDGQITFTLSAPRVLSVGENRFLVTYNF